MKEALVCFTSNPTLACLKTGSQPKPKPMPMTVTLSDKWLQVSESGDGVPEGHFGDGS